MKERFAKQGTEVRTGTPESLGTWLQTEQANGPSGERIRYQIRLTMTFPESFQARAQGRQAANRPVVELSSNYSVEVIAGAGYDWLCSTASIRRTTWNRC